MSTRRSTAEAKPTPKPGAPVQVPLRIDFGGGWLDLPRFADPSSFVVNCAITPLVSLEHWPYERNSGLGGSAAYNILLGNNAVETELAAGVGWQDPAIIYETGLCSWRSGPRPELAFKTSGARLRSALALLWTGQPHHTPSLVNGRHHFSLIARAGRLCHNAMRSGSIAGLLEGVHVSYDAQLQEGMDPLPDLGEDAKKYCGGGFGGYALFLFTSSTSRDTFVHGGAGRIAIEPYYRFPGAS